MNATFEPLTIKQQVVKLGILFALLLPMTIIALFLRRSEVANHFSLVSMATIIAVACFSLSSRKWIQRIK